MREPEFDDLDVAALIEARRRARVRRGPHGYTIEEATDPANQFAFEAKPRQDWAMKTQLETERRYREANPDAKDLASLVWDVTRRT